MSINLGYAYPLAVITGALAVGVWAAWHAITGHRRIPAAPDNQPGHDTAALTTCRHISALLTTSRKENNP
ncbi:hypothetical protein AB0L04_00735 [Streptomyces glaucescens]|uniref:hypothetical protein n=1 Tax=Streptomyces glaucescens TaxID=1907 RepID=UPI00344C0B84